MKHFLNLLLLSALFHFGNAARTQISCSVFLYGSPDWQLTNKTSECVRAVKRVREFCGGSNINFIITQHWIDANKDNIIDGFCIFNEKGKCASVTSKTITEFKDGMSACFKEAVKQNFNTLSITPHLDHYEQKVWRNKQDMNPLIKYDGIHRYWDVMLKPIVNAIKESVPISTRILFSMQGEMGYMVIKNPSYWHICAKAIKTLLSQYKKCLIGVSYNHSGVCREACNPNSKKYVNITQFTAFTNYLDFMGISNYYRMNASLTLDQYNNGAVGFAKELSFLGVNLAQFISKKTFLYSEIGVGGAYPNHNIKAKTPQEALDGPYRGMMGPYKVKNDPWLPVHMRDFRRKYYKRMIQWAAKGTGPSYRVDYAFTWNVNSWDIAGIYKNETGAEGVFRDYTIIKYLKNWNDKAISY
jgi:hypothetical protein